MKANEPPPPIPSAASPTLAPKTATKAEWLEARLALLQQEKELMRRQDALAARRRSLPRVPIQENYRFESTTGPISLADAFAGNSQLLVYHFMLAPGWQQGCKTCSFVADHFDALVCHLRARDTNLVAVSRAPLPEILAFRHRMGWTFDWLSSFGSSFNFDFGVSFEKEDLENGEVYYNYRNQKMESEELPGLSVFTKDASREVYHTYSTYTRGLETFLGTYHLLDLAPKGRDEQDLDYTMQWVRHHDRYDS